MQMKMVVLAVLFTFALITPGDSKPIENLEDVVLKELQNVKVQVAMECAEIYPVEKSTIRQIMTHDGIPDEQEAKCWLSCILQNMGIISNGKIDWNKAVSLNKMTLNSNKDKIKVEQIYEICKIEVVQDDVDECQLAYNIAVCKFKYGKEMGLPRGTWEE